MSAPQPPVRQFSLPPALCSARSRAGGSLAATSCKTLATCSPARSTGRLVKPAIGGRPMLTRVRHFFCMSPRRTALPVSWATRATAEARVTARSPSGLAGAVAVALVTGAEAPLAARCVAAVCRCPRRLALAPSSGSAPETGRRATGSASCARTASATPRTAPAQGGAGSGRQQRRSVRPAELQRR